MIKYNAKIKYQKIINRVKMKLYNMMFLTIDPIGIHIPVHRLKQNILFKQRVLLRSSQSYIYSSVQKKKT